MTIRANKPNLTVEQNIRNDFDINLQILLRTTYKSPNWDFAESSLDNLVELSNPNKQYPIDCYMIADNLIADIQLATLSKYLNKPTNRLERNINQLNTQLTKLMA